MNRLQEKLKYYGWRGTLLAATKVVTRKLTGFSWDKYCLMVRETKDPPSLPDKPFTVRELILADYENPLWASFLDADKKRLYIERFANPNAKAYGVFVDGQLAFSSWIQYGTITVQSQFSYPASDKDSLLFDSYCHPHFRRIGLHKYMVQYGLCLLKQKGIEKGWTIVLSYNRPSIKTQKRCGFQTVRKFHIFGFKDKKRCTLKYIPA